LRIQLLQRHLPFNFGLPCDFASFSVTLLAQVHANIRADPSPQKKERKQPTEKKKWKQTKLTYEQRKANLKVGLQRTCPS
jgi:hypothetical protein